MDDFDLTDDDFGYMVEFGCGDIIPCQTWEETTEVINNHDISCGWIIFKLTWVQEGVGLKET
jgi:hypothetical protein